MSFPLFCTTVLPYLETDCEVKVKSVHSFEYKEAVYMKYKYEYENNMKTCEIIQEYFCKHVHKNFMKCNS